MKNCTNMNLLHRMKSKLCKHLGFYAKTRQPFFTLWVTFVGFHFLSDVLSSWIFFATWAITSSLAGADFFLEWHPPSCSPLEGSCSRFWAMGTTAANKKHHLMPGEAQELGWHAALLSLPNPPFTKICHLISFKSSFSLSFLPLLMIYFSRFPNNFF